MKHILPIATLSALTVGMVLLSPEGGDGTRTAISQRSEPISIPQVVPTEAVAVKVAPKKQWDVIQTTFLAPVRKTAPVQPRARRVTNQHFNQSESVLVSSTQPTTYPLRDESTAQSLPDSRLLSSVRDKTGLQDGSFETLEDETVDGETFDGETFDGETVDDETFDSSDNGSLYDPDNGYIEDLDDASLDSLEGFEDLGPTNVVDLEGGFETSLETVEPPRIPNEAEQIGMLLQQISNQRATNAANEIRWSLDDAIMAALAYSNRVSSLQIESTEALQNVGVEYGEFDIAAFVTQSFRDSAEPVGSSIDTATGTQEIVNENDLNVAYGLRQQLRSGGEFEISQSYQFRDNDSGILIPEDQAFARLNGRLTKELLRGAGRSIAMNQVLVAYHDASAQRAESAANIADHLNEVMTAYWDIFTARGALFASLQNRDLAIEVRRELTARQDIDAEPNLIDQSEATIRQRELEIIEAHSDLVKAQIEFISLVNAPELLNNSDNLEILPQIVPDLDRRQLDTESRINTAIQRRPEIGDIIEQIKSAQVSNHLSLNELLPRLSLSLEAGLNGLEGDFQLGDAISNQFDNDVTYQVGVDFEVPLANRRARFNKRRTELVVARLRADWQGMIQDVRADVLENAQEFNASQQRLETQREVLKFTANELRYLALRKAVAPKETDNVSFALTQVLSAQDRQVEAKSDFIAAIADKYRAIFELNRATGILINPDVIPEAAGPGRPGCFAVYHHYLEERGSFEGPLCCVEGAIRAKSDEYKTQSGVACLNAEVCAYPARTNQSSYQSVGPAYGSPSDVIQSSFQTSGPAYGPVDVIQAAGELPAVTARPRYPLQ